MNEMDRILLYSVLSCLARYKIEYTKSIEINQELSNSIFNILNKYFFSKGKNFRLLNDQQQFKKVLINELISDSLATFNSSYNCILNSGNQQYEEFINDFSNISLYRDIIYTLIREYMIVDVFKFESKKESIEQSKKTSISIEDDSKVVFLGPKITIDAIDSRTENISIPITKGNDKDKKEYDDSQVIYSCPEGKAIRKTLKKDI